MVITPFHYALGLLIFKVSRKKLRIDGITLGCFLPDIEVPILFTLGIYPARRILHSLIGGLLLGPLITIIMFPVYIFILKLLGYRERIKLNTNFLISVELGILSHIILDALHHPYNPLFWPLTSNSVNIFILFGNWLLASYLLHLIFVPISLIIFLVQFRRDNWDLSATLLHLIIDPKI